MRKTATAQPRCSQNPKLRRHMSAKHRFPIQRRLIMFEKIGRFAETLATSAGQSRRGFLGRLGKGALGVAGVVGGLFLFQGEAVATPCTGGCRYSCPNDEK